MALFSRRTDSWNDFFRSDVLKMFQIQGENEFNPCLDRTLKQDCIVDRAAWNSGKGAARIKAM